MGRDLFPRCALAALSGTRAVYRLSRQWRHQRAALRIRIILQAADDVGVRESARKLDVWPKTVRYWRGRWRQAPSPSRSCRAAHEPQGHVAPDTPPIWADQPKRVAQRVTSHRSSRSDRCRLLPQQTPKNALRHALLRLGFALMIQRLTVMFAGGIARRGAPLCRFSFYNASLPGAAAAAYIVELFQCVYPPLPPQSAQHPTPAPSGTAPFRSPARCSADSLLCREGEDD
jgi:hypothetical protein